MAHDLIIIGAGPAGLAAALYASRKRLNFLVLSRDLGGKSNYRLLVPEADERQVIRADELVSVYRSRLEALRHSYRLDAVAGLTVSERIFTVVTESGHSEEARTVIVATGANAARLDVPGEREFLSRGLGYSSISYSHLFAGRRVFLAGDTDRVLNSAVEVSIQAEQVIVALLDGAKADARLVERVAGLERVELVRNAVVKEFKGDSFAREVTIAVDGHERTIGADGFFIENEPVANTAFLDTLVDLNRDRTIPVDGRNMTGVSGLFAAGDVTGNGYAQVLVSLGEGAKAGLSAYRYLLDQGMTR